MVRTASRGYETIVEVIMPGELFGGAVILQEANPAAAMAMLPSRVLSLPREAWMEAIRHHPELALGILRLLGERLRLAMGARAEATERVERRIAAILLRLAAKTGEEVEGGTRLGILLTRQDLAEMAGTTVETAIRVMSRFRRVGMADNDEEGRIRIRDLAALEEAGLE